MECCKPRKTEKGQRMRRTEAAAAVSAAAAGSRSIFSLERHRREDEGRAGMDFSGTTQGELAIPMHSVAASPFAGAGGRVLPLQQLEHGNNNNNGRESPALPPPSPPAPAAMVAEDGSSAGKKRAAAAAAGAGTGGAGAAAVKYRECLKNHAAAMGGNATDGCGEFMPSGEEGSLEALKCSACGCHRNFHRKEVDADDVMDAADHGCVAYGHRAGRRLLGPAMPPHLHKNGGGGGGGGLLVAAADHYGAAYPAAVRALPPGHPLHHHHHQQFVNAMPLSAAAMHASESDEMDGIAGMGMGGGGGGSSSSGKKRFRTKFTAEQKARMLEFAERVGWRLQKLDDAMVQAFCQEIGVRRRVLKVWMHNNKHNLATKRLEAPPPMPAMASPPPPPPQQQQMPVMPMAPPPPPSSQPAGPSFHHGGPSSPPPPLQMAMPMVPPPPSFLRAPGSPPPIKLD
ncbi:hypothetical protein EJB05_50837, partial [Eragrostis curvula]